MMNVLRKRSKFTPDFTTFRNRNKVLLFVYDEFVEGGLFSPVLDDTEYLGRGRTMTETYCMKTYMDSLVVVPTKPETETWRKGYIQGEVYAVTPDKILDIDYHKRQGSIFTRQEKFIHLLDQDPPFKHKEYVTAKCFMYFGVDEYWDVLESKYSESKYVTGNGVGSKRIYNYTPLDVQKKIEEANRSHYGHLYGDWDQMMY